MAVVQVETLRILKDNLRVMLSRREQCLQREGKLTTGAEWRAIFERDGKDSQR